jgi:hypothetical protein
MKRNLARWIQIILGILLFALLFFMLLKNQKNGFNSVEFHDNNEVYNRTENTFLDTITLAGLHSLNIKNTAVLIAPLRTIDIQQDLELKGYIIQSNNGFIIFIKRVGRRESIEIIAHELIHLEQLKSKRLVNQDSTLIFEGTQYDIRNIPEYSIRPWEIEAFKRQSQVESKIIEVLYN